MSELSGLSKREYLLTFSGSLQKKAKKTYTSDKILLVRAINDDFIRENRDLGKIGAQNREMMFYGRDLRKAYRKKSAEPKVGLFVQRSTSIRLVFSEYRIEHYGKRKRKYRKREVKNIHDVVMYFADKILESQKNEANKNPETIMGIASKVKRGTTNGTIAEATDTWPKSASIPDSVLICSDVIHI